MNPDHVMPDHNQTGEPATPAEPDTGSLFMRELESALFGFRSKRASPTKSEQAYAAVRRAVVTHELPSSVPLDENMLSEHFPYGRTPLREALKRLSYEGLLLWPPHQAPMIRDVGLYEMQHLYQTRRILEYEIAVLAAERATADDIEQMNLFRAKLADASHAGFVYEAVELDFALHAAIAQATQNRFLVEASNNLNLQSLRLWYRAQYEHGVTTIDKMHSALVFAISQHDSQLARELTAEHINSSLSRQQLLASKASSPLH